MGLFKIKMSYLNFPIFLAFTLCLSACVSMTPEAEGVMVHHQMSNLLDNCERMGNVKGEASGWKHMSWSEVAQQAENNARDSAVLRYGADTIAVINSDRLGSLMVIQAIAFQCE